MSNIDDRHLDKWAKMKAESASSNPHGGGGFGGGDGGDSMARIARIEADMEHVKKGMSRLESDSLDNRRSVTAIQVDVAKGVGEIKTVFSGLDERSKHFTTRWDVATMLAVVVALLGGIIALSVRFIPPA